MKLFRPTETAASIFKVDYEHLRRLGKRVLLFDLDNTLGKRRSKQPSKAVLSLLKDLEQTGFRIGILTNRRQINNDPVVGHLEQHYPLLHKAGKPRKKGFLELLSTLDGSCDEAVMIGDRLFTDILGANRLDIYSIRIRSPRSR